MSVAGPTISCPVVLTPGGVQPSGDGSFSQNVIITIAGLTKSRWINISADGKSFSIDGTPLSTPYPQHLISFGAEMVAQARARDAALADPDLQTLLLKW